MSFKAPSPAWVRLGQIVYRVRNILFPLLLAILLIGFSPRLAGGKVLYDQILDTLGILLVLGGLAFRFWVIGYEYIRRGGKNGQVHAEELVTGGLFAHCRNPMYTANLMLLIGILVVFHNPWAYLIGIGMGLTAYKAIVANEEDLLLKKFGDDYVAYTQRSPRWIPNFRGIRSTLSGYQFNWARSIVKDYNTTYIWLVVILAVWTVEQKAIPAYQLTATDIAWLSTIFFILTAIYLTVRHLKLSKRLTHKGWASQ